MQVLLSKHPHYLESVHSFIQQDPAHPIRQAAIIQLDKLSSPDKPGILHILHSMGGGARKYVDDLSALTHQQFRHYRLIATDNRWAIQALTEQGAGETFEFYQQAEELWSQLLESICTWLGIHCCHIHQISEGRLGLLAAFEQARIPYGISLHDFDLATPSMNALFHADTGNPIDYCPQCLQAEEITETATLSEWNALHAPLLTRAQFIIAPSHWTQSIYQRCYPDISITAQANIHQFKNSDKGGLRAFLLPSDGVAHIAVIGAIGPIKGSRHFEQLVKHTREQQLPIRWVLIGYTDRQSGPYQSDDQVLTIEGAYQPSDLKRLLDHYKITLTVFPSAGPETFCYTLSEVWANAIPVLVPPIGALKERVEKSQAGWIMEHWMDARKTLDQIMQIVAGQSESDYKSKCQSVAKIAERGEHQTALTAMIRLYQQCAANEPPVATDPFASRVYQAALKNRDQQPEKPLMDEPRLTRWKNKVLKFTRNQRS